MKFHLFHFAPINGGGLTAIVVVAVLICLILAISIGCSIHKKRVKIVLNNSQQIESLLKLNEKYNFQKDVNSTYKWHEYCDSKRKFDQFNYDNLMYARINADLYSFERQIEAIKINNQLFTQYLIECQRIHSSATQVEAKALKIPLKSFLNIEKKLFAKHKQNPVLEITFFCSASYTSPQGRNSYKSNKTFTYNEFLRLYENLKKHIAYTQTKEHMKKMERQRMTSSMRYDVFTRDNYKCQICGVTSEDGAKLHVDHIIPVSKGGRTELINLRTLCDKCNLGKSDKYNVG